MGGAYHRYEADQEYLEFHKRLAARLRAARVGAELTQVEMAKRIGVSKSVLSKSESSTDPQKTPAYIVKKYAELSGRNIVDFFEDNPNKSRTQAKATSDKIESIRKQLTWLTDDELDIVYSLISQYLKVRKIH